MSFVLRKTFPNSSLSLRVTPSTVNHLCFIIVLVMNYDRDPSGTVRRRWQRIRTGLYIYFWNQCNTFNLWQPIENSHGTNNSAAGFSVGPLNCLCITIIFTTRWVVKMRETVYPFFPFSSFRSCTLFSKSQRRRTMCKQKLLNKNGRYSATLHIHGNVIVRRHKSHSALLTPLLVPFSVPATIELFTRAVE